MNMKPQKPLPKAQVKVDLKDAETINCEYCDNYLFITSTIIKPGGSCSECTLNALGLVLSTSISILISRLYDLRSS